MGIATTNTCLAQTNSNSLTRLQNISPIDSNRSIDWSKSGVNGGIVDLPSNYCLIQN